MVAENEDEVSARGTPPKTSSASDEIELTNRAASRNLNINVLTHDNPDYHY